MQITHPFVSSKSDSSDATLVQPSNWNASHTVLNGPVANVKDYGAVGDGVADDTVALKAAIAANIAVYAPAGIYKITSVIDFPYDFTLYGEGGSPYSVVGTTFKCAFAGPGFRVTRSVSFIDFVIDGVSTAASVGLLIGGSDPSFPATLCTFRNITVKKCYDNIEIQTAWGLTFDNIRSRDAIRYGFNLNPPTTYPGGAPTVSANPPVGSQTTTIRICNKSFIEQNGDCGIIASGSNIDIAIEDSIIQNNGKTNHDAYEIKISGSCRNFSYFNNYIETLYITNETGLYLVDGLFLTGAPYAPTGKAVIVGNFFQCGVYLGNNRVIWFGNTGNFGANDSFQPAAIPLTDTSTYGVLGPELITNGSFTGSAASWALGAGWSYASNHLVATGVTGGNFAWQNMSSIAGALYKITYTITSSGPGNFKVQFGTIFGAARSISGTYTDYITASQVDVLYCKGFQGFNGTLDDISVKLVTPTAISTPTFIGSETGANNAIVATLASGAVQGVGMFVRILLAHTLQIGANTFNYNGNGAASIKRHTNPANDIGTTYAVGAIIELIFDGTVWQDLSQ